MIIWSILTGYALATLTLGCLTRRRSGAFKQYVIAGADQSGGAVSASLLATVIGASSTLGMINLGYRVGFASFWWLGSGAIGLVLCGVALAGIVKHYQAVTLADLMGQLAGGAVAKSISLLVATAWIGVVAAQFIGAGKIIATIGHVPFEAAQTGVAVLVGAYCILGGQVSVFKTDKIQLVFILLAVFLTAGILASQTDGGGDLSFTLTNDAFGLSRVSYFMIIVGSGFLAGPDIISRLLAAKNVRAARTGAIGAGLVLALVSGAIAFIGLWAQHHLTLEPGQDALSVIIDHHLNTPLQIVVTLGILSAILSSADTCLITAAATVGHDLLGTRKTGHVRILTGVIAAAALGLGLMKGDIIETLVLAYAVFNCGAIPTVTAVLLGHKRRRIKGVWAVTAIGLGGALGVWGKLAGINGLSYGGMGAAWVLAIIGLGLGEKIGPEAGAD